ncbi:transporter substrate-binding domain-containing protein [Cyanobacterium sp. IPPAS B-1200]|uniref:transporter substrate-binding domain-containing protein n=1 Tax=Cyanobacterium sp. IPPAS B-1200 TaxID=1562720 RepID=UPI0008525C90|nr:transporter substrate-binding domain-containing protein [Cyanobacterium sp. IPPAS B-1200]OEJ79910.1 ABC transporter substrate-binding protein [Cyanobacterium sp. IPPAS B-1200]
MVKLWWVGFLSLLMTLLLSGQGLTIPWAVIENRGRLLVGITEYDHRPLSFRDNEDNLQGLEIDIIHRLAQELLGNESAVEFIPLANNDRLRAVIDGKVDLAIASITVTRSRLRVVDFSHSYYLSGTALVSLQDSSISNNDTIAVLEGSSAIVLLKQNLPSVQLQGVTSYQEGLSLVAEGKVTAFAGDITLLTGWTQENPQYSLLPQVYGAYPLAIALPKGLQHQELRDKINQIMANLARQGWLQERIEYWGLR